MLKRIKLNRNSKQDKSIDTTNIVSNTFIPIGVQPLPETTIIFPPVSQPSTPPIVQNTSPTVQTTPPTTPNQPQNAIVPPLLPTPPRSPIIDNNIINKNNLKEIVSELAENSKETLDNEEIMSFISNGSVPDSNEEPNIEVDKIDNFLLANECARFTIKCKLNQPIKGVFYTLQSDSNFLNTSHLDKEKNNEPTNKFAIVINNLSNKKVSFTIGYVAFF